MAVNQSGVAITIKAWLPVTGDLDEQIAALQIVKTAHETGDYAEVLKAAKVDEVKSEQKTRRVDVPPEPEPQFETERGQVTASTAKPEDFPNTMVQGGGIVEDEPEYVADDEPAE